MSGFIRRIIISAISVCGISGAAIAQQPMPRCGDQISINGAAAMNKERAIAKAVDAWRTQVITKYGVYYGDVEFATHTTDVGLSEPGLDKLHCGRTIVGLYQCEVRGQPCMANKTEAAVVVPPEIGGRCRFAEPPCDTLVIWVQHRLNRLGARIAEDGREGAETRDAIRWFKSRNGLRPANSQIDEPFLGLLRTQVASN
jgi:Putative peptidoglycan binding domain